MGGGIGPSMDLFNGISLLVPVFFILVAGIIVFKLVQGVGEWASNNSQPRQTVPAVVVSKRTRVSGGHGDTSAHTSYFATFEMESGERIEMHISGSQYGQLAEGDRGELTFQGTRYFGFIRSKQTG